MCAEQNEALDGLKGAAGTAQLAELQKTAERLRDIASYLANHDLEHEAAYVMMAFKRVYARIARVALKGAPESTVAA